MGNRPTGYWILFLIAVAAAVAAFILRSDPHTHAMAQYLAWSAVALLLIGRFFFRAKPDTTPPMPKD